MLSTSLDFEATVRDVARAAVGEFADWCVVDVVEAGGVRREVAHADPAHVDDNLDAAAGIAAWLGLRGHEVRVAGDAPAALAAAAELRPDVALLDIGLPVMDGYELAARLRAMPALRNTKLVAITGYGQDEDRTRSARAGFAAHLVKPVPLEEIDAIVEAPDAAG